jgi:hypothetical protein
MRELDLTVGRAHNKTLMKPKSLSLPSTDVRIASRLGFPSTGGRRHSLRNRIGGLCMDQFNDNRGMQYAMRNAQLSLFSCLHSVVSHTMPDVIVPVPPLEFQKS